MRVAGCRIHTCTLWRISNAQRIGSQEGGALVPRSANTQNEGRLCVHDSTVLALTRKPGLGVRHLGSVCRRRLCHIGAGAAAQAGGLRRGRAERAGGRGLLSSVCADSVHCPGADGPVLPPGVIFDSPSVGRTPRLPPHVTYTLRTSVSYSMRTDLVKNPFWKFHPQSLPADGFKYNYVFVPLQDMIETAIVLVQTGQEAAGPAVQAQAAPYPCHSSDL